MKSYCVRCGTTLTGDKVRWCSLECKNQTRTTFRRSALNDAVDVLYAACGGRHVASGYFVTRDFFSVARSLAVCVNCGVPIRGEFVRFAA